MSASRNAVSSRWRSTMTSVARPGLVAALVIACTDQPQPTGPAASRGLGHPAASVSGVANGKIAFTTGRDGNGDEIYVMNADGSGQTPFTNTVGNNFAADWSPDGTKLVFVSERDGRRQLYAKNADGSGEVRLTNHTGHDLFPAWSADGTRIVFSRDVNGDGDGNIWVMNADGSGATQLTTNPTTDYWPTWSPDGATIAFVSTRDGNGETIYVMNADGSAQTRLTNNPWEDYSPEWSPDGTKIVFTSSRDGNEEVYVMNADGSAQTRLTNTAADSFWPAWSPDGTQIVFSTRRDGDLEIYVMNAGGSNQTRLTNLPSNDTHPDWQPVPGAPPPGTTPPGTDVTVQPAEGGQVSNTVSLLFSSVTTAGVSSLTTSNADASANAFRLGDPAVFYNLTTTAAFTGSITVCVNYSGISFADAAALRLYHGDGSGGWTDVTTTHELSAQTICGSVTSLSPFLVAAPKLAQTIAFTSTPPAPALLGGAYVVNASGGGSGNPVTFTSLAPLICGAGASQNNASTVSLLAVGTCIVAADQAADENYAAASQATQSVAVIYNWSGFFAPVDNAPVLNIGKAGSAIPIKFKLGGNQGLAVFASGYPKATVTACGGGTTAPIEETVTAGASSLSYDAAIGQYTYVWKTDKGWVGGCRELLLQLIDGTTHHARFQFTR